MTETIKIGVLCGSLRAGSFNEMLGQFVARKIAEDGGVEIDALSLMELDLPMLSPDIDGIPENVGRFKDWMISCDAILVSSPEFNGSLTGALKNAIDWASSPRPGEKPFECFQGKACGLLSASPGGMGGLQGLVHARQILTRLQMHVIPAEYALGNAHEAFDDAGNIKDEKSAAMAANVGREMVRVCRALKG
ncbi:MAG: NAD(P)H-dependent oxidoreductase [Phycisphaerales bacterium]|nr:NAD(P)H-dependent oxidoreductase [Phycisphaerales bacterium]